MLAYPAIDIRGGRCVRLSQGRDDARTDYYEDPVEPAVVFAQAGAAWIHVVDLDGAFGTDGELPLNTHGGLLSFGHSGAAGGMAHIAEAYRQLAGRAGSRQIAPRRRALLHADGGVLSAHVSLILERRG